MLDEVLGPLPTPRPKVVASDGVVVRDADVHVSPKDPNARYNPLERSGGVVVVRRANWVTINMEAATAQWWANVENRELDRARHRQLDPYGWGHWGPTDDE
jgi:hypothetical protein